MRFQRLTLSAALAASVTLSLIGCTIGPVPGGAVTQRALVSQAAIPASGFGAMLNAQRATAGLLPATPDARLAVAAQVHADDMAAQNYFSHTGLDGRSNGTRVRAAGYDYCRSSENIAFGQRSEAEALQGWIGSPGHLANIMMRGTVQYGLGHAGNKWVLVVAAPC